MSQIGRDGELDDNERALLLFVKEQAATVAPELAALIDKAGFTKAAVSFGRRAS